MGAEWAFQSSLEPRGAPGPEHTGTQHAWTHLVGDTTGLTWWGAHPDSPGGGHTRTHLVGGTPGLIWWGAHPYSPGGGHTGRDSPGGGDTEVETHLVVGTQR